MKERKQTEKTKLTLLLFNSQYCKRKARLTES